MSMALPGVNITPVRCSSCRQNASEVIGRSYFRSAVVPDCGLIQAINGSAPTQSERMARLVDRLQLGAGLAYINDGDGVVTFVRNVIS